MSHYAVSRVKILNPNKPTLEKALRKIATKLGGTLLENEVVIGWGFRKQVNYLVKLNLPYGNGYGVEVSSSGIKIHVDEHGAPVTASEFSRMLTQYYVAEALKEEMENQGWYVEETETDDQVFLKVTEGW